jgi:hypothetical protein
LNFGFELYKDSSFASNKGSLKFWEGFWEEKVFRMEKSVFCLGWAADFVWDLT